MKRHLKFRIWETDLKRMNYKGGLTVSNNEITDFLGEPMQFTGLLDRHGKEIYEGDVLATSNNNPDYDIWDKEDNGYTVIEWDNENSCFRGNKWTWDSRDTSIYSLLFIEVIGNIYETPELLKV